MSKSVKPSEEIICEAQKRDDWSLNLFLSVDIEGATAYKTAMRSITSEEDWGLLFETFYNDFPAYFLKENQKMSDMSSTKAISEPHQPAVWKYVGDEILFYATLTDSGQTLKHLWVFYQSVIDYNRLLREQGTGVQCKGTAWIAGFPVNNRIVSIPKIKKDGKNEHMVDFIGPSIDCGFRLSKYTTSRKLVISLDLLWIIAEALEKYPDAMIFTALRDKIRYEGKFELKGVLSGTPYPIFWIDTFAEPPIEEQWTGTCRYCTTSQVISFCQKFETTTKDFIRPFIHKDKSKLFDQIPDGFEDKRQRIIAFKNQMHSSVATKTDNKDVVLATSKLDAEKLTKKLK